MEEKHGDTGENMERKYLQPRNNLINGQDYNLLQKKILLKFVKKKAAVPEIFVGLHIRFLWEMSLETYS